MRDDTHDARQVERDLVAFVGKKEELTTRPHKRMTIIDHDPPQQQQKSATQCLFFGCLAFSQTTTIEVQLLESTLFTMGYCFLLSIWRRVAATALVQQWRLFGRDQPPWTPSPRRQGIPTCREPHHFTSTRKSRKFAILSYMSCMEES